MMIGSLANGNTPQSVRDDYGETDIPRSSKTLPERLESVLRYSAYFTEDFSVIAAPCTRIITNNSQSWTPRSL